VLSSRQIDEWLKTSTTTHKPNDHDMGLDEEEQLSLENVVPVVVAEGGEAPVPAGAEAPAESDAPAAVAPSEESAPSAPVQPETPAQP
jgi:hypothetical protein